MSLRDIIGTGRQRIPAQLVATETPVRDPRGRFWFEMPWPWFERKGEFESQSPGQDDLIVLFAPRTTDPWPEGSIWSTEDTFDLDDQVLRSESRRLAHALRGKTRRPRRLLVGGVPAAAFFVETADMVIHQVIISPSEGTTFAVFRLPLGDAAGYEVHVETMLATWQWI